MRKPAVLVLAALLWAGTSYAQTSLSPTVRAQASQLTASQAKLVRKGFQVFNKQTFKGNGRTCSTCHLPQRDFTISAADIPSLSPHLRALVRGTKIKPGNAGSGSLENPTLVNQLGLFNIHEGVGGTAEELGNVDNPAGPFRSSMQIAGLAFTTVNMVPDFFSSNCTPFLSFISGGDVQCSPPPAFPAPATPIELFNVFLGPRTGGPGIGNDITPGVDEGTRNVQLGWSGDGTSADPDIFGAETTSANQDCKDAIEAANADPTDLTKTLRAFSLTAVETHLTKSLNRMPGVDFRCPTPAELDELAAFQEYLGRQFELALKAGVNTNDMDHDGAQNVGNDMAAGTQVDAEQPVITFSDPLAEKGKAIFLSRHSQCSLCHFNAGANSISGEIVSANANDPSAPFPSRNLTQTHKADLLRCTDKDGVSDSCLNAATATAHGLNAIVAPVVVPQDPGDKVQSGGVTSTHGASECGSGINTGGNRGCVDGKGLRLGQFNVQSLIEAPRKTSFFHNGAFTSIEDAVTFYFSPTGDKGFFVAPRKNETGAQALDNLTTEFGPQPLDTLAFFLRALSTVYAIADCERLVNDSIGLVQRGEIPSLQVRLCVGDLKDVPRLVKGAKVSVPDQYTAVTLEARKLVPRLRAAAFKGDLAAFRKSLRTLQSMRHSLATITPDLPD